MKNALIFGLVVVCSVLMASESVMALGGGGGGKKKTRARMFMTNVSPTLGTAVWVRTPGTALPATLGALRNQMIFINPGDTRATSQLKNGRYDITVVDAATLAGPANTPISQSMLPPTVSSSKTLDGVDLRFNVSPAFIQ